MRVAVGTVEPSNFEVGDFVLRAFFDGDGDGDVAVLALIVVDGVERRPSRRGSRCRGKAR